jgi:hypothetical protein
MVSTTVNIEHPAVQHCKAQRSTAQHSTKGVYVCRGGCLCGDKVRRLVCQPVADSSTQPLAAVNLRGDRTDLCGPSSAPAHYCKKRSHGQRWAWVSRLSSAILHVAASKFRLPPSPSPKTRLSKLEKLWRCAKMRRGQSFGSFGRRIVEARACSANRLLAAFCVIMGRWAVDFRTQIFGFPLFFADAL